MTAACDTQKRNRSARVDVSQLFQRRSAAHQKIRFYYVGKGFVGEVYPCGAYDSQKKAVYLRSRFVRSQVHSVAQRKLSLAVGWEQIRACSRNTASLWSQKDLTFRQSFSLLFGVDPASVAGTDCKSVAPSGHCGFDSLLLHFLFMVHLGAMIISG